MTIRKPFGRINEELAKLSDDKKPLATTKQTGNFGSDVILKVWTSRAMMAKVVRQQERANTCPRWRPVVKLGETEGYS